jgi:hypothetical protein
MVLPHRAHCYVHTSMAYDTWENQRLCSQAYFQRDLNCLRAHDMLLPPLSPTRRAWRYLKPNLTYAEGVR